MGQAGHVPGGIPVVSLSLCLSPFPSRDGLRFGYVSPFVTISPIFAIFHPNPTETRHMRIALRVIFCILTSCSFCQQAAFHQAVAQDFNHRQNNVPQSMVTGQDLPPLPLSLTVWPHEASPREIGNRVARRFLQRPLAFTVQGPPATHITYPEVCAWYGALAFARLSGDSTLQADLVHRFEPLFHERQDLVPVPDHVDMTVFAAVPLEIAVACEDPRYRNLGITMADRQWGEPFGVNANGEAWSFFRKGLTWQTRLWIDDMFMITVAQAQAFRATGERKYIDRAASEMVIYIDSLQRPNGLFFHAPDVPFFWGRGNGWVAAGMSELLRSLPSDNPDRQRIMDGYQKMMASLLRYQDADGMWHQLVDAPDSWPETSCSGMFTFALITGVRHGWLDSSVYGPAARKGWLAVSSYLNGDGDIREVCEGTGKKNNLQYYLNRKRNVGDMHGQAPILWCAAALLR
jgi:unsaturated rhamnogalacturonyl hydrolase